MIRNPVLQRRNLLRRLADLAEVLAIAHDAYVDGRLPADVADTIATAGSDLAVHRRRLKGRTTADDLTAARRWADGFGRNVARVLMPRPTPRPAATAKPNQIATARPASAGRDR